MINSNHSFFVKLFVVQCLMVLCFSQDFDFFYLVQQVSHPQIVLHNPNCYISIWNVISFSSFFNFSGRDPTATVNKVAAIQRQGSRTQISGFMASGLTTRMAPTPPTAIPITLLINPRYPFRSFCFLKNPFCSALHTFLIYNQ